LKRLEILDEKKFESFEKKFEEKIFASKTKKSLEKVLSKNVAFKNQNRKKKKRKTAATRGAHRKSPPLLCLHPTMPLSSTRRAAAAAPHQPRHSVRPLLLLLPGSSPPLHISAVCYTQREIGRR